MKKSKALILLGPRQSGKTTLIKELMTSWQQQVLWMNGDEPDHRAVLTGAASTNLRQLIGRKKFLVIDEAQRIENIGLTIKLITDTMKNVQVIATGSSSLELSNKIREPLTGRKREFTLYPVSFEEMALHTSLQEEKRLLEHRMIYGYYPEVVTHPGEETDILRDVSGSYLYKDLYDWEQIKKPQLLEKLLQALALQVGHEVSYRELAGLLDADNETVERYIALLEKAYVIFILPALSRNVRSELKKGKKIYFYDNGIRNAIIKNFNPVGLRNDAGALFENFIISERKKRNEYHGLWYNSFFWRTHLQQEIDYVEEYGGQLHAVEIKWNPLAKSYPSKTFTQAYPQHTFRLVNKNNVEEFVMAKI